MKKSLKIVLFASLATAVFGLMVYLFLSHDLVILEPKGDIASQQRNLLVFASLLSLVVILPVYVLTVVIAVRYRESNNKSKYTPEDDGNKALETLWWGIPIAIIFLLSVITWKTTHSLDPFKPLASEKSPLTVQVVALQWKWLFIYPEQKIATVNYLKIPENTPVNFKITSDAPMNSFWIPQLGGQIYAMSGMATELNLIADKEGTYDGYSANISGTGFADMKFTAESTSQNAFVKWVNEIKYSDNVLDPDTYAVLSEPGIDSYPRNYVLGQESLFADTINKYMAHENTETSNSEQPTQHNHMNHEGIH